MIIRIVRMEFQTDKVDAFEQFFRTIQQKILDQPGCQAVRLHKDASHSNIWYTYSHWDSQADLEAYRHSELFAASWAKAKSMFDGKPMAFSLLE